MTATEEPGELGGPAGPAPTPPVVLAARDLVIEYRVSSGRVRSLDSATLTVRAGEITALVGESGSGKTTLGMATGRLLAANAEHLSGTLEVAGEPVLPGDRATLRRLRREVLGYVFQNPVAALDPTMRVGRQLALARRHTDDPTPAAELLESVGLPDIPRVLGAYPHELSGGMAQRVAIAIALSRRPALLVADEPTASVDATLRGRILRLLVERCRARGCALLLLTHDLHSVATHATRVAVMYGGRVVESGPTADILARPLHPYTRALFGALPGEERLGQRLTPIPGVPPVLRGASTGCAFAARCPDALDRCASERPEYATETGRALCCHLGTGGARRDIRAAATAVPLPTPVARDDTPVVSLRDVRVTYRRRGRRAEPVHALRGVSVDVGPGETLGIVGESGSGKTTLSRVILGLRRPDGGRVVVAGQDLGRAGATRVLRGRLQVVLQNPDWSLNPNRSVLRSVAEPLLVAGGTPREARPVAVEQMLARVGLDPATASRRPHELSGGQRQRVAIARALITNPDVIVFDEAVTALDVSVQTQVLNLIRELQAARGFAAVFISHDLAAVRYVAHRIAVARAGELVEIGPVARFYGEPEHPYSRQLMATLPTAGPAD